MKNTLSIGLAGLFLCVLTLVNGAFAEIKTLPLNGCEGTYTVSTPAWTMDFDLGVSFSEISHVYIDWSGEATAGLIAQAGEPPYTPWPMDTAVRAYINLGSYAQYADAFVGGGVSTYPSPYPFDTRSEYQLYLDSTWSDICNGRGSISIYYYLPIMSQDRIIIDYGSVTLNGATLVVDGTIIPEPSTIVLLSIGLLQIIRTKNRNRRK